MAKLVVKDSQNRVLGDQVLLADQMFDRLLGLMFSNVSKGKAGLLLDPCNSIHTFFMRYPIDVLFLDGNDKIVKIIRKMKPWRLSLIYFKAHKVLEFEGGLIPDDLKSGDQLELVYV